MSLETVDSGVILIVDDEISNLQALMSCLEAANFRVLVAKKGSRGLQIAESARPDLILLDIRMPELDGYELCIELKARTSTRDIPVIFMTAYDESADRIKCFEVGGVDYLAKPFQVEEVLARVRHQITIRSLQAQLEQKNAELELRVLERTAELERTNGQLRREIAERQQTEAALKEAQQRYELVVRGSGDGVWDWNLSSAEAYVSSRYKEILGYRDGEIDRVSCKDFEAWLHPEDRDRISNALENHLKRREAYDLEYRIRKASGEYCWVSSRGQAIWDEVGNPIRMAGSISDITPLKQAEADLRQANEELELRVVERTAALEAANEHLMQEIRDRVQAETALREAQERYELAVRGSGDGIWDWNVAVNESYISPRYKQILGYSEDELAGYSRQDFLNWLHPDDRDRVSSALENHFKQRSPYHVEYRIRKASGEYCWVSSRGQAIWDAAGNPTRMAGSISDITPLKQAEAALRRANEELEERVQKRTTQLQESEQKLRAILDNTTSVIYMKDIEGRYQLVNSQFLKILDRTEAEVLGKSDLDLFPPEIAAAFAANDRQVLEAGSVLKFEENAVLSNGKIHSYVSIKAPLRDESATAYALCGISTDITEQKQAERLLRDSQERLRLFVEHAPSAIAMFDHQMRYLAVSRRWLSDYDLRESEILGRSHYDVFFTLNESCRERHQTALSGTVVKIEEELLTLPDGNSEWLRYEIHPWHNHAGEIGGLMMCTEFISDRKQAQLQLEQLNRELFQTNNELEQLTRTLEERVRERTAQVKESEAKFRAILNNIPHKAWLKDEESRFVAVNLPFCKFFGLKPADLVGKTDYDICPPDRAQHYQERDRAVIASGQPQREEEDWIAPDGELRWVETYKTPISGDRGEIIGTAGIAMDITERKRTESELQQLNQQLRRSNAELERAIANAEAANQAKSDFLAKMTHELRTPLNAILGFSQILTRADNLELEQRQQLDIVLNSGEHLLTLIDDILDMSKIEAGKVELNPTNCDFYGLIHSLEQMLQLKAQFKGLHLSIELAPDVPRYICTDEQKLRQVLINLLGNAIKFTETGSVTLCVSSGLGAKHWVDNVTRNALQPPAPNALPVQESGVRNTPPLPLSLSPPSLHFEVKDTGRGIASHELEGLFEAFAQSETGRYTLEGGTGLGLAISKHFVELMGGRIAIDSTLDVGTTVRFDIAIAPVCPEQAIEPGPCQRVVYLAPNQPEYRILVVEDRWENRQLLVQLLSPLGFNVLEASNGLEGIQMWEKYNPQLVLMDLRMPVMDGYEALQQIKATLKGQATTVIVLTASAFEVDRSTLAAAGCNDYLRKPFQTQELLEAIARHLGVQYIYESNENHRLCREDNSPPLTAESLAVMPTAWLAQLHACAVACDREEIAQLLADIPADRQILRQQLEGLIENFNFPAIAQLTEAVLEPMPEEKTN